MVSAPIECEGGEDNSDWVEDGYIKMSFVRGNSFPEEAREEGENNTLTLDGFKQLKRK
jgi:hypothetical protein